MESTRNSTWVITNQLLALHTWPPSLNTITYTTPVSVSFSLCHCRFGRYILIPWHWIIISCVICIWPKVLFHDNYHYLFYEWKLQNCIFECVSANHYSVKRDMHKNYSRCLCVHLVIHALWADPVYTHTRTHTPNDSSSWKMTYSVGHNTPSIHNNTYTT